jgi:ribosomal protein S12 methylthiotransferase accessory factor
MISVKKNSHDFNLDMNLSKTVGKLGGIVQTVINTPNDPGDPPLYFSVAIPSNPNVFLKDTDGLLEVVASGIGETKLQANNSAVGEAVERYCAGYIQKDKILYVNQGDLKEPSLNLHKYPLYSRAQYESPEFPYHPFSQEKTVGWVKGKNLTKSQIDTYVPAAFVWDSYRPLRQDELFITYGIVTGSACGKTINDAIINGLLEIIERDSFMIMWYNQLSLPKIDINSFPRVKKIFGRFFERSNFQLDLIDTTTDIGVPSVFGLLRTDDKKIFVGGAARLTMEEAIIKTLLEISQLYIGNKNLTYSKQKFSIKDEQVIDCYLRVPYYLQKENQKNLEFIYASSKIKNATDYDFVNHDNQNQLQQLLNLLKGVNLEVFAVDITTPDVKEAGLFVVKTIVPGAVSLPFNENEKMMMNTRIYQVPVNLKYLASPKEFHELNHNPHPFP